jgi:16S rRNA (guanine527-N7)-methyltransferase
MSDMPGKKKFTDQLIAMTHRMGVSLERAQAVSLYRYYEELWRWNRRINLVSRKQPDWLRVHFTDSLAAVSLGLVGGSERVVDLGAGAGFPGLVLKVACPDIFLAMAEASGKKCAFLKHIARRLELSQAEVLQGRFEDTLAGGWADSFDLVVSRAAAKPGDLLVAARPFLKKGGRVLAYTTEALVEPGVGKVHPYAVPGSEVPSIIWEVAEKEI